MTATMITIANFAEDGAEALQRYVEGVLPLLEQAGAKVQRYGGVETLVGRDRFDLVAVMEFPNDSAMKQFLSSDAYMAMEPYREKAFQFLTTFASNSLL
ncbi:MAG: DUF1330 domain-containing protein [Oscillatoriales cyanobacterium RM2_1_1]|nr:DUF1330 domain-containing protein [Oscillatoriales cyanobacterium SM2_3_0]NJO47633.1 DUF1330 domain-containing protein [Oscillatoriales cyanobacterium RM2_1_1]